MKYVLVELQTNNDGTVGNIVTAYDDLPHAEAAYHSVLAAAAVSALPEHAAVLLTSDGETYASKCYRH